MTTTLPGAPDIIDDTTESTLQSTHRVAHWASAMAAAIVMSGCATDPTPRYTGTVHTTHPTQRQPAYTPPIHGNRAQEQMLIEQLKQVQAARRIEEERERLDRERRKQAERFQERERQLEIKERDYRIQNPNQRGDGVIIINPNRY